MTPPGKRYMTRRAILWGGLWALLVLAGLGLVMVPNGMRFTGYLFLGTAAVWAAGSWLVRWGRRSRTGKIFERLFFLGLTLGLVTLAGIETAVVFRGEADNSAIPVDAVIVLGAGVNEIGRAHV